MYILWGGSVMARIRKLKKKNKRQKTTIFYFEIYTLPNTQHYDWNEVRVRRKSICHGTQYNPGWRNVCIAFVRAAEVNEL